MPLSCGRLSGNADIVKASNNAPPLAQGARNEGVRVLQMALIDLGQSMPLSTGGGTQLPDGIFGSETAAAVRNFQRVNGLAADGVAGRDTLTRLDQVLAAKGSVDARISSTRGSRPRGMS